MIIDGSIYYAEAYDTYDMLGVSCYDEAREREISYGEFGVVFRKGHDRAVKLPFLYKVDETIEDWQKQHNRHIPEMFNRELHILEALGSHPSIVEIFSASYEDGIEMEYLEGGNLQDYINRNPYPSLEQRLRWILQIAEGLQYLHTTGILHNDIALRNLMLTKDLSTAKIIDFSNSMIAAERTPRDKKTCFMHLDMWEFAGMAYSVLTWQHFQLDLFQYFREHLSQYFRQHNRDMSLWPDKTFLPSTDDVPYGDFLVRCWLREYDDMEAVCADLRNHVRQEKVMQDFINTTVESRHVSSLIRSLHSWVNNSYGIVVRMWRRCFSWLRYHPR